AFNGALYFIANSALWTVKGDGSILQVAGAPSTDATAAPIVFNGALYFEGFDGSSGDEPWKVKADGSVVQVADINPGSDTSFPDDFTIFDNALYFSASDGTHGSELWKIAADGSVTMVADIDPGSGTSLPSSLTVFGTPSPVDLNGDGNSDLIWRNVN